MTKSRGLRHPTVPMKLELSDSDRELVKRILGCTAMAPVLIEGLGIFERKTRPARNVVHPVTREPLRLAATVELRFRAIKASKEHIRP